MGCSIAYIGTGDSQNGVYKEAVSLYLTDTNELCRSDNFISSLSFSLFYFRVFC